MHTKIVAKAVIFDDQNRVLLLKRSKTDERRPGEQDYPGGGVELGEDVTAAVSREIFEEAGLQIEPNTLRLFYTATEQYRSENIVRLLFWAQVHNPQVKLSFEHDDFHWVAAEKAYDEFPHPVYGRGLQYALKYNLFEK